jgi:hypothetical protein
MVHVIYILIHVVYILHLSWQYIQIFYFSFLILVIYIFNYDYYMIVLATFFIVLCNDMLNIEMLLSSNLKYNQFSLILIFLEVRF